MGTRTDPNANESVVMLPESDEEFANRQSTDYRRRARQPVDRLIRGRQEAS